MRWMMLVPVAVVAAALVTGCTKKEPENTQAPPAPGSTMPGGPPGPPMPGGPTAKGDPVAGRTVFLAQCQGCHGASGQGVLKGTPNFTNPEWQKEQNDAELIHVITNGQGKMPAWKDRMSAKDIANAEAYVRTLGKPKAK